MLPAALLNEIESMIDEGDDFLNADAFTEAADRYQEGPVVHS